jgi:hypothetical protein
MSFGTWRAKLLPMPKAPAKVREGGREVKAKISLTRRAQVYRST